MEGGASIPGGGCRPDHWREQGEGGMYMWVYMS